MILSVISCPLWRFMTFVTCRAKFAFVFREAWGRDGSWGRKVMGTSLQCTQLLMFVFGSEGRLCETVTSFWLLIWSWTIKAFKFVGMLIGYWFVGPFITLFFDCIPLRIGRLIGASFDMIFEKSSLYFRLSDSVSMLLRWKLT